MYRWLLSICWLSASALSFADEKPAPRGRCRAGCPQCISKFAMPSDTGHYIGYYVGGGCAVGGQYPTLQEGTWGWDYSGLLFCKRISLLWSHGKCYQGGTGAYKTDGPRLQEKEKKVGER